ncbi:hypothetical protein Fcan01_15825 [Folsomia candida]|uniref:F-box domain-containing protein n=1 Tax=Folsomia candida TaxID=158441 RepID=A0A226DVX7_FOLCA|nr:hypothetical protein Fcan01_15825 [Folsomia candida]
MSQNHRNEISVNQVFSNPLIVHKILSYLSLRDVKAVRLLNKTCDHAVLTMTPAKLRLYLGKYTKAFKNDYSLSSSNLNLFRQIVLDREEIDDNVFLHNHWGTGVDSVIISDVITQSTSLRLSINLIAGRLRYLKRVEIQNIDGSSELDLLVLFMPKVLPNLKTLQLAGSEHNFTNLFNPVRNDGMYHPGVTSIKLVWINVSSLDKIGTMFPNLKKLEIGDNTELANGKVFGAIFKEFILRRLKVSLGHVHLHVTNESANWDDLVELMMQRREHFAALDTLAIEVQVPLDQMVVGRGPLSRDEVTTNFKSLSEIKFINFVWTSAHETNYVSQTTPGPKLIFENYENIDPTRILMMPDTYIKMDKNIIVTPTNATTDVPISGLFLKKSSHQWHRWESLSLQIRDSHATQIRELRILRKREKNASMDWYIAWMRKESARFAKFASNKIELHALQRKARNLLIHRVVRERQKIEDRFSKIEERLRRQQNMVFEVLERFRDKTPRHLKLSNLLNQKIA